MNNNQKKFGIYVFLSTFSRNLIEVFIPVILYKFGYSIKEIVFYYLLVNIYSLVLTYPFIYLSKKINSNILSIIGIISFVLLQIELNLIIKSIQYIIIIAFLFAVYRRGYWISRRYYNLQVMENKNISKTYSIISIINQIGVIISAYIGSIFLDYVSLKVLTVIAIILFVASIIPLFTLELKNGKNDNKVELINTFNKFPKSTIYLFGTYELINVVKFFIPLYLFIYVKNNYQTIGLVNLITNFALILFTYLYGKKLDESNNTYLKIAIILTVIIYILKINTFGYILLIVSFIEGIIIKMYELSINKLFYTLSKSFDYNNYNLIYELTQNIFRSILVFIFFILNLNLKYSIYFSLAIIFIGVFLKNRIQYNENN